MKRWIKNILIVLCLLLVVPIWVHGATGGSCGENASWSYDETSKILTISGSGPMDDFSIFWDPIPWQEYRGEIEAVMIEEGITYIGNYAFYHCGNLKTLPQTKSLVGIGYASFAGCDSLKEVRIPENVTDLQASFMECEFLHTIHLPEHLESIDLGLYTGTAVAEVTLPASVVKVEAPYSPDPNNIQRYSVEAGSAHFRAVDGVLFSTDGTELVAMPLGRTGSYMVPDGVEKIGDNAFCASRLTEVILPASLREICTDAFAFCPLLTEVVIPEGVTLIGARAFLSCENLASIQLPHGLKTIENSAFMETALTEIVIPLTVTEMDYDIFGYCEKLEKVIFVGEAPKDVFGVLSETPEDLIVYYPEGSLGWEAEWQERKTQGYSYTLSGTATCTSGGVQTITGSELELCYTYTSEALGHDAGVFVMVQPATTASRGKWNRTCTRCGHVEPLLIPAWKDAGQGVVSTYNKGYHDYSNSFFVNAVHSYLVENEAGFLRVDYDIWTDYLTIEQYDDNFSLQSQLSVATELDDYDGYYTDGNYHFLVFEQENWEENDSKEVLRVVRYSKDWQRMDCASLRGIHVVSPVDGGTLRMASYGDYLYVRTCYKMYTLSDGLNHQTNLFFCIYIPTMQVVDIQSYSEGINAGGVSHSFNQFVIVDGDRIITLDQGDGNPRAAVLHRFAEKAGSRNLACRNSEPEDVQVLKFYGKDGLNGTLASLGGLEASDTHYLTVGTSAYQTVEGWNDKQKNVYITATPKDNFTEEATVFTWVTNYPMGADTHVSTPQMVKLSGDRFLILWTESEQLKCVFTDGSGSVTSGIYTCEGSLSECQPIVADGKVVWYVTDDKTLTFCVLDPDAPGKISTTVLETAVPELDNNPFVDVEREKFYYEPVLWAYYNGITTGKDATHFNPSGFCTRSQVVTFLWRAAGEPEPESLNNPFPDVPEGKFYTKAVLWAVEQGITAGYKDGTFGPNDACTRGQIVTFLWRYFGEPEPQSMDNPFPDVVESKFYYKAVLWAVENEITGGFKDGTFGPNKTCTRDQIVTFLYRAMA